MKALVIILIIYTNYVLSIDVNTKPKYTIKKYPKKVVPGHVQIINSGKYVKTKPTKKTNEKSKLYTVFPNSKAESMPDSPYFPIETAHDQKPRVKKVLPDYTLSGLRSKRSAPGRNEEVRSKTELHEPQTSSKVLKKTADAKSDVKSNSQKLRKLHGKKKGISDKGPRKIARNHKRNSDKKLARKGKRGNASVGKHGKKPKVLRRLIAARDAKIEEYPYVVSIQKDKQHWCAGALLNPRLVITTANCMWKANRISRMKVRAGSRHTDRGGEEARIAEVMKHPGWGIRREPDNDIALVLLDRNLRFSDTIHSLDLPNRAMVPAFDDAWVTSWGAERRDGVYDPSPMSLQVYHARLMNRDKCNNVTQRFGVRVTENFICLAQTGKRSPCTRDTGAPAVSDGVLWGLASWGIRKMCGTERYPAVFSYTGSDSNMDFIINATHQLMSDNRYNPFPDKFPS